MGLNILNVSKIKNIPNKHHLGQENNRFMMSPAHVTVRLVCEIFVRARLCLYVY